MKLVKGLLLGSAAGLVAVAGAQAADLPMQKAAPVEYVRICSAYGAGFFYIPGTDTCLRVGGRARGEYEYRSKISRGVYGANATGPFAANGLNFVGATAPLVNANNFSAVNASNDDVSGFRGLARINLDARTQTAYGTLRAFVRVEV